MGEQTTQQSLSEAVVITIEVDGEIWEVVGGYDGKRGRVYCRKPGTEIYRTFTLEDDTLEVES
ncbi:MAG: hypothetical protein JNK26_00685 [Candidatus Doudnabacteria bacterium]|nr:hypothetical protein [Candidatus Doudnabacteria bacterium]